MHESLYEALAGLMAVPSSLASEYVPNRYRCMALPNSLTDAMISEAWLDQAYCNTGVLIAQTDHRPHTGRSSTTYRLVALHQQPEPRQNLPLAQS